MAEIAEDGLMGRRQTRAALAIWVALIAVSVELMSMSVMLPAISRELAISPAAATWLIKGYQLGVLLALLPFSSLGETIGYRYVYQGGLVVYSLAAAGCLWASDAATLTAFRALQGVGVSAIVSVNGALVRHTFPKHRLTRAFAVNSVLVAVFGAVGPSLGSTLVAVASWRWLFALALPLCAVSFLLGIGSLPHNRTSGPYPWTSALLYVLSLGGLFVGTEALRLLWPLPLIAAVFAAAAVAILLLWQLSRRIPRPLVPVDLLASRLFLLSILTSIAAFTAQTAAFVGLPFHLIARMDRPVIAIGWLMMAWPLAVVVAAPIVARLGRRVHISVLSGIGLVIQTASLVGLSLMDRSASTALLCLCLAGCGFGFGFFQAPNNHLVLTSAPIERAGAAAGMQAIARHIGQICGASMVAALFTFLPGSTTAPILFAAFAAAAGGLISLSRRLATPAGTVDQPALSA